MAEIHEIRHMRNQRHVFKDRFEAGKILGQMLLPHYHEDPELVLLTIPMGGVPVALGIRQNLKCPMDLLIVRKIQIPGNTEAGFGAMTSEGDVFLNEPLLMQLKLTPEQVERQSARVRKELEARSRRLRGARDFPDIAGKKVILVDDGLASGFTMKAAVFMVNKRRAAQTIVAVPTAPQRTMDALSDGVDRIYCANVREVLSFAVAEAYRNWHDISETEALELLGPL